VQRVRRRVCHFLREDMVSQRKTREASPTRDLALVSELAIRVERWPLALRFERRAWVPEWAREPERKLELGPGPVPERLLAPGSAF